MSSCSIIVPVRNRASLTQQLLDALCDAHTASADLEHGRDQLDIIVVDRGSTDGTAALLAGYGSRLRVVRLDHAGSVAAARNAGAAIAAHDLLLFIDPAITLARDWLAALLRAAESQPDCSVFGGKLLDARDAVLHAGIVICQDRVPRSIYRGLPAHHPAVNRSRSYRAASGGYLLVRREAFEAVHGFDAVFVEAHYDEDLCFRLGALGRRTFYCHDSVAHRLDVVSIPSASDTLDADRARLRARWLGTLTPDDFDYYAQDNLLRVDYNGPGPLTLHVAPDLATTDESARTRQTGQILADRASLVHDLWREKVALIDRVRALEARAAGESVAIEEHAADDPGEPRPPEEMIRSVGGQFSEAGEEYLPYFCELGGLRPTDQVLDIGCGVGRMAVKLAPFLQGGAYEGFDIRRDVVEWCQQHITPAHPHARFAYVDLENGFYNRAGSTTTAASAFRFPYPAGSFDFVLLTSVFTHMLPAGVEQYLSEIVTVLKPGGVCFCTYFLLTPESLGLMQAGLSGPFTFTHRGDGYRAIIPTAPEAALAYDERWVRDRYREHGLRVVEPVHYGSWCGRLDGLSLQDIVIAVKEDTR